MMLLGSRSARNMSGFYVLLSGKARPTEEVLAALRTSAKIQHQQGRHWIILDDYAAVLNGLPADERECSRVWFYVPRFEESYKKTIEKCLVALGWSVELRWKFAGSKAVLPPRADDLIESRNRFAKQTGGIWHMSMGPALILVFSIFCLYYLLRAPRPTAWHSMLVLVFSIAVATWMICSLLTYFWVPSLHKRVREYIWLPVLLLWWYGLGGPAAPVASLVFFGVLLVLTAVFLLMRRRARRKGTRASDVLTMMWFHVKVTSAEHNDRDAANELCLACRYCLHGLETCRCPECGTMNYYLTDRADARELALKNDAVFAQPLVDPASKRIAVEQAKAHGPLSVGFGGA